jgi:uncharacterized protein (DUF1330 family)
MKRRVVSAFVIVSVDAFEEEAALAYAPVAQQSILSHGGRYLVAGPTPEPVEGTRDSLRFLVIEFPDMDRIRQWYDSPEYRRARQIRGGHDAGADVLRRGCAARGLLAPGLSVPAARPTAVFSPGLHAGRGAELAQ